MGDRPSNGSKVSLGVECTTLGDVIASDDDADAPEEVRPKRCPEDGKRSAAEEAEAAAAAARPAGLTAPAKTSDKLKSDSEETAVGWLS